MERLTKRMPGFSYAMCGHVIYAKCEHCTDRMDSCYSEDCKVSTEAVLRLAMYEDTDLTPEQVASLKAENEKLKEALHDSYQVHLLEVVIPKLEEDNALLRKQLDKAVEDINYIANKISKCDYFLSERDNRVNDLKLGRCDVCKGICHDGKPCSFEWRGLNEEAEK
jgi:hypothetical protein